MKAKFKVQERKDPRDPALPAKYYPEVVSNETIGLRQLISDIVDMTSTSSSDIMAILEALMHLIPKYLKRGLRVSLGEFGRYFLSISGEGKEKEEDVDASAISKIRIRFLPGTLLRKYMKDVEFERAE
jgi:predicted histone-like DNA-binding protein